MAINRKFFITIILLISVSAGVAAINSEKNKERNLKVLPKDISDEKLDSIMQTYNIALGVKCNFCHVPMKNIADSLDYFSHIPP